MNIRLELERRISAAMRAAGAEAPAMVTQAAKPEFGDYQANGVMTAAKKARVNPRQLAQAVVTHLAQGAQADISDIAEPPELAGPGFINLRLKGSFLSAQARAMLSGGQRLGIPMPAAPPTVVVDYSGPNLAKEMHVGHLRSTIIGDALARTLEFAGNRVIRQNHAGEWGTQFGMLIAHLKELLAADPAGGKADLELADLEDFYRKAKQRFDADAGFAQTSRAEVVKLQSRDPQTMAMWRRFVEVSLEHCDQVYRTLNVGLTRDDLKPESSYNADLPGIVESLRAAGLLTESQGAQCVFLPEFADKSGQVTPMIVQKSDEGYLYATTDLAAARYRAATLHADRVLYVVDSRQSLHLRQVFVVALKAGLVPPTMSMEHVSFGTMLGPDGKPFKTRAGGTTKLMDLLEEAVARAFELVTAKNSADSADGKAQALDEGKRREIAQAVGIGAVKYADLSQNRNSDYVFSWDKMLSLEGNTAPYMQYAYARVRSIFRKAGGGVGDCAVGQSIPADHGPQRALVLKLAQFHEALDTVACECLPNVMCAYLYDLAGAFMSFYENCPVLQAPPEIRAGRLALCELTARVIATGLDLLGINTIEQM
jgi:arginyl-tRNA synthetase